MCLWDDSLYYKMVALQQQQAFLRQLYSQVTLITGDPAPAKLFRHCRCYTAATKAIKDKFILFR